VINTHSNVALGGPQPPKLKKRDLDSMLAPPTNAVTVFDITTTSMATTTSSLSRVGLGRVSTQSPTPGANKKPDLPKKSMDVVVQFTSTPPNNANTSIVAKKALPALPNARQSKRDDETAVDDDRSLVVAREGSHSNGALPTIVSPRPPSAAFSAPLPLPPPKLAPQSTTVKPTTFRQQFGVSLQTMLSSDEQLPAILVSLSTRLSRAHVNAFAPLVDAERVLVTLWRHRIEHNPKCALPQCDVMMAADAHNACACATIAAADAALAATTAATAAVDTPRDANSAATLSPRTLSPRVSRAVDASKSTATLSPRLQRRTNQSPPTSPREAHVTPTSTSAALFTASVTSARNACRIHGDTVRALWSERLAAALLVEWSSSIAPSIVTSTVHAQLESVVRQAATMPASSVNAVTIRNRLMTALSSLPSANIIVIKHFCSLLHGNVDYFRFCVSGSACNRHLDEIGVDISCVGYTCRCFTTRLPDNVERR
jgi:hypothetical protein